MKFDGDDIFTEFLSFPHIKLKILKMSTNNNLILSKQFIFISQTFFMTIDHFSRPRKVSMYTRIVVSISRLISVSKQVKYQIHRGTQSKNLN